MDVCQSGIALAILARAPSVAGKTRLLDGMGPVNGAGLRRALLQDTWDAVARVHEVTTAVVYTPILAADEFRTLVPAPSVLVPQREGELAHRLHGAFEDLQHVAPAGVLIVGSDLPTVPVAYLQRAADLLKDDPRRVVLGPASDGGYYVIGLGTPDRRLFEDVPWSTDRVFRASVDRAHALGFDVATLPEWYDIDTPEDLARALGDQGDEELGHVAAHTRAWAAATRRPGE